MFTAKASTHKKNQLWWAAKNHRRRAACILWSLSVVWLVGRALLFSMLGSFRMRILVYQQRGCFGRNCLVIEPLCSNVWWIDYYFSSSSSEESAPLPSLDQAALEAPIAPVGSTLSSIEMGETYPCSDVIEFWMTWGKWRIWFSWWFMRFFSRDFNFFPWNWFILKRKNFHQSETN